MAPDQSWLASGYGNGTIRIWDPATGSARYTLTGHAGTVEVLAVAPHGSWLASAHGTFGDVVVHVWNVATDSVRNTGCLPADRVTRADSIVG